MVEAHRLVWAMLARLEGRRASRFGLGCLRKSSATTRSPVSEVAGCLETLHAAGGAEHALAELDLSGTKERSTMFGSKGSGFESCVLIVGSDGAKVEAMCFRNLARGEV